jgi:amino acid transporter
MVGRDQDAGEDRGSGQSALGETRLRENVIGLPAATIQGITHMAPAAGIILSVPFIASFAGAAFPLAYMLALIVTLIIATSIGQLAKHLPSAGGFYSYLSRGINPSMGFLTGWMYFLYDPLIPCLCTVYVGALVENTLLQLYGIYFPWYVFTVIVFAILAALTFFGIRLSIESIIFFAAVEVLITLALSVTIFATQGVSGEILRSGFTLAGTPQGFHGLLFGMIFSVLAFTGFESSAPLAEETRDPRRTIKWAVVLSTGLQGIYYLIFGLASLIAYGVVATIERMPEDPNPFYQIANSAWGSIGSILILLALVNSAFGCSLAGQTAGVRVFYKMGTVGVLPSSLGRLHPRYRTPHVAIAMQTLISLIVGLGLGFWLTPAGEFGFLGVLITVGLIFVYGAGMLAVPIFYRREHANEINPLLTYVLPILGIAMLALVLYGSVIPIPDFPLNIALLVDGAWLVLGLVLVFILGRTRPRQLMAGADEIFGQQRDEVEERL